MQKLPPGTVNAKFKFIPLLRTISTICFSVRENKTLMLNNCQRLANSKNAEICIKA